MFESIRKLISIWLIHSQVGWIFNSPHLLALELIEETSLRLLSYTPNAEKKSLHAHTHAHSTIILSLKEISYDIHINHIHQYTRAIRILTQKFKLMWPHESNSIIGNEKREEEKTEYKLNYGTQKKMYPEIFVFSVHVFFGFLFWNVRLAFVDRSMTVFPPYFCLQNLHLFHF